MQTFLSNGKLLLTAEYVVLDGAKALALPTSLGQSLSVTPIDKRMIVWQSLDEKGNIWFEENYHFEEICFPFVYEVKIETMPNGISKTLLTILYHAVRLNKDFFSKHYDDYDENGDKIKGNGFKISTQLDFPINWGLGTSSTLINNIAQWFNIDPYELLERTFGGSGYDIACAQNNSPITYQLKYNTPEVLAADFNPPFKKQLYFVYLNKKQDSRSGIAHYKNNMFDLSNTIKSINAITEAILSCTSLSEFERLVEQHETIISKAINQTKVKDLLFSDFNGSIKSLGAWGGDFILVASKENPKAYFESKGYTTILNYTDIIK
ncbi:GYDIA family GHMP kinase [Aestuariivivens marinum]|uniref:GYDIA family GHMP kinase n=1 Tax=Aestuariivivens marinum TaxID=2913555 RepID=UPI001F57B6D7|nr:GYDIA family GHMP kinase [Aestuariivivens marinum]